MRIDDHWNIVARISFTAHKGANNIGEFMKYKKLDGFMLRYIKHLKPNLKRNYEIIPYSDIDKFNAWMYMGKKITREERHKGK